MIDFTEEQCDEIIKICESKLSQPARVFDEAKKEHVVDANIRITNIAWIEPPDMPEWFRDNLVKRFKALAKKVGGLEFNALHKFQYSVYHEGGHYDWHRDEPFAPGMYNNKDAVRVMGAALQLSDPEDYEGGDLEFNTGKGIFAMPKDRGKLSFHPINMLHHVTPVTKGIRKTLIMWTMQVN